MNIEAFNQLLRVLKEVKENERKSKAFNLGDWSTFYLSEEGFQLHEKAVKDLTLIPHNCGCTACACGYAGLDSWFREQGFTTLRNGAMVYSDPAGNDYGEGWEAVTRFFGIPRSLAHNLFSHHSYRHMHVVDSEEYDVIVRVEEVIKRVEEFIKCQPTQCV